MRSQWVVDKSDLVEGMMIGGQRSYLWWSKIHLTTTSIRSDRTILLQLNNLKRACQEVKPTNDRSSISVEKIIYCTMYSPGSSSKLGNFWNSLRIEKSLVGEILCEFCVILIVLLAFRKERVFHTANACLLVFDRPLYSDCSSTMNSTLSGAYHDLLGRFHKGEGSYEDWLLLQRRVIGKCLQISLNDPPWNEVRDW